MGRKAYRKPVPQIVEKAQAEVGSDKNIDHGFEHQGKEAGSTVNQEELRKQNKIQDKERFNLKEAVEKASACISVFIPKSDIIKILTVGNLILGKFLSSLDQKLLQLKDPSYLRCALYRKTGEKATIGAHVKPTIDNAKLVKVFRIAQELTAADIAQIEAKEKEDFKNFQDSEERAFNLEQDALEINHNAEQLKNEVEHYKQQAISGLQIR